MIRKILYKPIGIIHTPFIEKNDTPIQGCFSPESKGQVEIYPEYVEGLDSIKGFSHLILLYHFHKAEECSLKVKPFLDKEKKGIFACRYFARPNPIGLSIVKLYGVNGNILDVGEVDMLDGTPLLDIKPYVPEFDIKGQVQDGWYKNASERAKYNNG
jgi:tRNA-Thr(GGU) m(6)t(6)A37 methyltransferase TsaA